MVSAAPYVAAAGASRRLLGLRVAAAAAAGWSLTMLTVRPERAEERAVLAGAVAAAGAMGSALADRWHPRGAWSGLALLAGLGLYAGVPETNRIVGLCTGLAVLLLADVLGRLRTDGTVVVAMQVVLLGAVMAGAANRPGALVVGLATLGLLLLLPLAWVLPGPGRPLVPARLQVLVLLGLQAVYALALARLLAWRMLGAPVIAATVGAILLLLVAARLVMGRRPWSSD